MWVPFENGYSPIRAVHSCRFVAATHTDVEQWWEGTHRSAFGINMTMLMAAMRTAGAFVCMGPQWEILLMPHVLICVYYYMSVFISFIY